MAALPQTKIPEQPDYLKQPPQPSEKLIPAVMALIISWLLVR